MPLGFVGMEYMPQTDESSFTVNIQAPVGSSPEETNRVAERIEGKLAELPEVKYYMTQAGGSTAYEGRIKVQLVDRRERSRTVWQVANDVRKFAATIKTATCASPRPRRTSPASRAAGERRTAAAPCRSSCAATTAPRSTPPPKRP